MTITHKHEASTPSQLSAEEWKTIYRALGGHIYFQTLSAAVQFDLFGLLQRRGPLNRGEIAQELGIQEKPARILLLGCTALGLLSKSGECYGNTRLSEALLIRGAPGSIVSVVEWQHFINYRAMFWLHDALVHNTNSGLREFRGEERTLYGRLTHDPMREQIFQNAMHDISIQAVDELVRNLDFSSVSHLVDVGGGDATNAMRIVLAQPHLRVTVFDSQSVCAIAEKNIIKAGLQQQVGTAAGDCFKDPFPEGVDCILFAHFMTIWSEEMNKTLLKKAYDSLPSGGRVIVFNMMQSDAEDGPLSAAMGSPYFLALATGDGMLYTWSEYECWMREAGFENLVRHELPRDHGAILGKRP